MARARIKGVIVCKKPGNLNRFSKKMEGRKEGKMEGRKEKNRNLKEKIEDGEETRGIKRENDDIT